MNSVLLPHCFFPKWTQSDKSLKKNISEIKCGCTQPIFLTRKSHKFGCEIESVPFTFFGYEMKATTCKYQANRCCILTGKTTAGDALMSQWTSRSFSLELERELPADREKHNEEERKMSSIPKPHTPWSSFNYTLCDRPQGCRLSFLCRFCPIITWWEFVCTIFDMQITKLIKVIAYN